MLVLKLDDIRLIGLLIMRLAHFKQDAQSTLHQVIARAEVDGFKANLSFVTPMAYQTNIMIMNAGGYKFGDFVRVGLPLTVMTWLILSGVLIWAYEL